MTENRRLISGFKYSRQRLLSGGDRGFEIGDRTGLCGEMKGRVTLVIGQVDVQVGHVQKGFEQFEAAISGEVAGSCLEINLS